MKILLAEADGALAGRLFHLLVKNGYQTTAVKTGQAALDCLIKPVDDNELLLRITALQRRTQTGGEEALRFDVELRLVKRTRITDILIDSLRMASTDVIIEAHFERCLFEFLNGTGRVEAFRAFGRAFLAVEAAPKASIDNSLEVLFRIFVTGIPRDLRSFDENERIEEVFLIQRAFLLHSDTQEPQRMQPASFLYLLKSSGDCLQPSSAENSSFG